jgi:predicted membrane GTPase involved in stress response
MAGIIQTGRGTGKLWLHPDGPSVDRPKSIRLRKKFLNQNDRKRFDHAQA